MINEKVKQIELNINEILEESKDFLRLNKEFNALLKGLNEDKINLKQSRKKLLNFLLIHSKRKILFEFEEKDKYNFRINRKYTIGLNKFGLGILCSEWEHNLRNINEYYGNDRFEALCKIGEFVKEFLNHTNKHLKGEHKEIIKKCIDIEDEDVLKNKNINVGDITIEIIVGSHNFRIEYTLKNNKNIYILEQDGEGNLSNYRFSFEDLNRFNRLCKYKPQIIEILKGELKEYKKIYEDTKTKLTEIKVALSPYEALENI